LLKALCRPPDGLRAASPALTLRPSPGAMSDVASGDCLGARSGQLASDQKQLAGATQKR
jgi:hypothetical protein